MIADLPMMALSLGLLLALMAAVRAGAVHFNLPGEIARKAVHLGLGLYCLAFPWLFDSAISVALLCAAAVAVLLAVRLLRGLRDGLGQALHAVGRHSYGEVLFAASVGLLFVLMDGDPVTYVLPIAILTLSDSAAALVGRSYGLASFQVEDGRKSLEGTALFFLTAWIVAMACLLLLSDIPRPSVLALGFLVAAFGTVVEAQSWRGWDNLFVPLTLHLTLTHLADTPPLGLALGGLAFCAGLGAAVVLARRLGYDRHAGIVIATALGAIAVASTAWNLTLPVAAFLCLVLLEHRRPSGRPHALLPACMALIALSLTWYLASRADPGLATIYAFNVSFAAIGGMALALCGGPLGRGVIAGIIGLWGLVHLRAWVADSSTPTGTTALLVSIALLAALALLAVWQRRLLDGNRPWSLAALALLAGTAVLPLAQLPGHPLALAGAGP